MSGEDKIAYKLPLSLASFFYVRKPWDDHLKASNIGIGAATRSGSRQGHAWLSGSISLAYLGQGRLDIAAEYTLTMLTMCADMGDQWGESMANNMLGRSAISPGRSPSSLEHYQRANLPSRKLNDE